MARTLAARPLTAEAFAPFGHVIEAAGAPSFFINNGRCARYHDLARPDIRGAGGAVALSVGRSEPVSLPYTLVLLERHPLGSQAFVPMTQHPFLICVAPDQGDAPGTPLAFLCAPGQAINFHRGTWHGVLTPLHAPGLFAVIDRIGDTDNLNEYPMDPPWRIIGS